MANFSRPNKPDYNGREYKNVYTRRDWDNAFGWVDIPSSSAARRSGGNAHIEGKPLIPHFEDKEEEKVLN